MDISDTIPLTSENTIVHVIDPQMRECAVAGGLGTEETEAAVEAICTLVPKFRALGIPINFVWSKLDATGEIQMPQDLAADAPNYLRLTESFETSLGGFHPRVRAIMTDMDRVSAKFTTSALHVRAIRDGIARAGTGNDIVVGFNYSDCVTRFAVDIRADKQLPPREVYVLRDASADNSEIALAEMYSDCGVGESANSMIRRAMKVRTVRSRAVLDALGIK